LCDEDPTAAPASLIAETAAHFSIREDEVRTAIAYYSDNRKYIDAVITLNADDGDN